jgi:hypothetical protein
MTPPTQNMIAFTNLTAGRTAPVLLTFAPPFLYCAFMLSRSPSASISGKWSCMSTKHKSKAQSWRHYVTLTRLQLHVEIRLDFVTRTFICQFASLGAAFCPSTTLNGYFCLRAIWIFTKTKRELKAKKRK